MITTEFYKTLLDITRQASEIRTVAARLEFAMQAALQLVKAQYGHIILYAFAVEAQLITPEVFDEEALQFRVSLDPQGDVIKQPETPLYSGSLP